MNKISANILTAVILTYNEEHNIGRVLNKLTWLERIVVIDSFSTDTTLEILSGFKNVEVYQRKFDTHAIQWNYGLNLCNSRWILSLDADYVLPEVFVKETLKKIDDHDCAAFDTQFRFLVFGKPLRGNNTTPRPVLFQKALCVYYDDGHTQRLKISGKIGAFVSKIDHDDRKPLSRWLSNQAGYSLKESNMLATTPDNQLSLISKVRKTKIFAPILIFFYCLFIKGLLFNGWRGWYYTLQRTIVEMLFALRLIEKQNLTRE